MPVFEKRGTRPGFTQVNTNLWVFLIVCLCIAVSAAVFLGTRNPVHSSIEKRTVQILTYHNPNCRHHSVDSITFLQDGNRIVNTDSCGDKDSFYFKNDGLEFTPQSPNYGKPFLYVK
jgi:hypothetical protein